MTNDWQNKAETKGAIWGINILLFLEKVLGQSIIRFCIRFIMLFYWLFNKKARLFSKKYIQIISQYAMENNIRLPKLSTYTHFVNFGDSLFDKLLCWAGKITLKQTIIHQPHLELSNDYSQGMLILGSHLGNIEVCRGLAELETTKTIHVLMHTLQTQKFNSVLLSLNPKSQINIISITNVSPETMIFMKSALDSGDHVAILADRLPISKKGAITPQLETLFLGQPTIFPKGPFLLALLLNVPTFFMVGIKRGRNYHVHLENIEIPQNIKRSERDTAINSILSQYIQYLTHYCLENPLQWFNFYDFWPSLHGNGESCEHT